MKAGRIGDDERLITVEEFLAMPDDRLHRRQQLIGGRIVSMAPAGVVHARIVANLADRLMRRAGACAVLVNAGVQPAFDSAHHVRVPDLLVTCELATADQPLVREPLLIAEVLSPGNARQTREGLLAYATIASVQEIILIDSRKIHALLFARNTDGSWPHDAQALIGAETILTLPYSELTIRLGDLYLGTSLALEAGEASPSRTPS
jgi:Uma2 family endonuclease